MQRSPHFECQSLFMDQTFMDRESAADLFPQPRPSAEAVYRGLTIAAMLMLLASLWIF